MSYELIMEYYQQAQDILANNVFQDYGIIDKESVHTLGYEAKISILASNRAILFISYGESQTLNRWLDEKTPFQYIQMSLINPF